MLRRAFGRFDQRRRMPPARSSRNSCRLGQDKSLNSMPSVRRAVLQHFLAVLPFVLRLEQPFQGPVSLFKR